MHKYVEQQIISLSLSLSISLPLLSPFILFHIQPQSHLITLFFTGWNTLQRLLYVLKITNLEWSYHLWTPFFPSSFIPLCPLPPPPPTPENFSLKESKNCGKIHIVASPIVHSKAIVANLLTLNIYIIICHFNMSWKLYILCTSCCFVLFWNENGIF